MVSRIPLKYFGQVPNGRIVYAHLHPIRWKPNSSDLAHKGSNDFYRGMLENGIYLPIEGFENRMGEKDIEIHSRGMLRLDTKEYFIEWLAIELPDED